MTITVLSIVFTHLSESVVSWAKFVMFVAHLGGNLSINLGELLGTYLGIFLTAPFLLLLVLLVLTLFVFFAALGALGAGAGRAAL